MDSYSLLCFQRWVLYILFFIREFIELSFVGTQWERTCDKVLNALPGMKC